MTIEWKPYDELGKLGVKGIDILFLLLSSWRRYSDNISNLLSLLLIVNNLRVFEVLDLISSMSYL